MKKVKLFVNNNEKSLEVAKTIKEKLEKVIINEDTMNNIEISLKRTLEGLKSCPNLDKEKELIIEFNKVRDHYLTLYWVSYIGYLKDTKDEKYLFYVACTRSQHNLIVYNQ